MPNFVPNYTFNMFLSKESPKDVDPDCGDLSPVMKALRFGTFEDQRRLFDSSSQHDPDRVFFTCCLPEDGRMIGKPKNEDLKKYIEFLKILAKERAERLHVAQIRSGLLKMDEEHKHALSKSPNAMWRFSWAKGESEKGSAMWQTALRGIKREATSLIHEINVLKALWCR